MVGADPLDDPIEDRRPDHLAEREFDIECREIIFQRDQLLAARRLVDAVHDRRLFALQRLGRRDVGGDHKILDQAMRVEALARRHGEDAALLVEHDAAFGQVELERLALVARSEQRAPRGPEWLECFLNKLSRNRALKLRHRTGRRSRFNDLLACGIHRGLCILIGNVCGYANLCTRESPVLERSVLADMEVAGQRRSHLPFLQRADVR